jgi:large subunit ribosomal protein L4
MKLDVLKLDGSKAGSVELDEAIFGVAPRADILHRVVRYQLAKRRAGTHDTQNRGDVIFRGGGVAHGPHPRDHSHSLNKKVRALGMKMALSAKVADGSLVILDKAAMDAPKTKALLDNFAKLGLTNALIIGGAEVDGNFKLAARNIPNVDVLPAAGLNVYDVLRRHKLVLSRDAIEAISARFADKGEAA